MTDQTFPSAVAWWYYAVIVFSAAVVGFAAMRVLPNESAGALWVLAFSALLAVGLPIWLLVSTRYIVRPTELVVRSGPFVWRVPRERIVSISPSRSPLSAPALSLNRLEISYNEGETLLVSPKDREGFVSALGFAWLEG